MKRKDPTPATTATANTTTTTSTSTKETSPATAKSTSDGSNNNRERKNSKNQRKKKGCLDPCKVDRCYVCYPDESGKEENYFWREDPKFQNIFINQNLGTYREIVIVPRQHIGELRLMNGAKSRIFWNEAIGAVEQLVRDFNMQDVTLEVSYGDWIVHKKSCPNYHAHVHVMASNAFEVLKGLKEKGVMKCEVNRRNKDIPPEDATAELPFKSDLVTTNWEKFPLFVCVEDWFGKGKMSGFALSIQLIPLPTISNSNKPSTETSEVKTKEPLNNKIQFSYSYKIRTGPENSLKLAELRSKPPHNLKF